MRGIYGLSFLSLMLFWIPVPSGAQTEMNKNPALMRGTGHSTTDMNMAAVGPSASGLTFEARVMYQRAIEEVYWRHRIWPKENRQPKPTLDDVMPEKTLGAKVKDYLRQSEALAMYWKRPITEQQLQAEMERMARQTTRPDMLRELWRAL